MDKTIWGEAKMDERRRGEAEIEEHGGAGDNTREGGKKSRIEKRIHHNDSGNPNQ